MAFVKLDTGILDSSLWVEDAATRIVFITMLAMSDPEGLCAATAPGIARRANLPLGQVRKALAELEGPDPESRTLDHEGRRIERVDGGYMIFNYAKYRAKDHTATARKRRQRERESNVSRRDIVTSPRDIVTVTQAEAEAEVEVEVQQNSSEPRDAAAEPPSPVIFKFPTVGKMRTWPLTEGVLNQYRELYPTLNVEASARRALHWLTVIKPTGKKTARGMHRFLNGWFERAIAKGEDLAATTSGTRPDATRAPSAEDLEAFRRAREDPDLAGKRKS